MSTPFLFTGRRTLASPFIITRPVSRPAATRAGSTLAVPSSAATQMLLARPVRPTIAAVSTTTCARARSTLATPWLPRPARPATVAPSVPAGARARSTLATPWLPRPARPATIAPSVTAGARARSTLATPWLPHPPRPTAPAPATPAGARARHTLASPWVLRPIRPAGPSSASARAASTLAALQVDMTYVVNAFIHAKEGHEAELKEQVAAVVKASREEPGTISYNASISEDGLKAYFFEVYKDEKAAGEHVAGEAFGALRKWFGSGALAAPPSIEKGNTLVE